MHQTCKNLTHCCVRFLCMLASYLRKRQPLLRRNPSHTCIKPTQSSPTPISDSLSCVHQTCTSLSQSCVWILLMRASNLQKPHPPLCLNPSHACIRPAKTSPTVASVSFACLHHTCANVNHSCVGILLIRASNLRKAHPLLFLNLYHACIKPVQVSASPATESLSCVHQACTNLTHSCVWILLMRASNLQKPHPPLCLNPSHACIRPAKTSPTVASVSFACLHHTCANVNHSCVGILLIRASNLRKAHPLLILNLYHACIKPVQVSASPATESLSCVHQACTNLTHSCVWILFMRASNLQKPHPPLCLNPSHACIRPAKTSPTVASVSFACLHHTCANVNHSCVGILLIRASNLRKAHPLLFLNLYHACIKPVQVSASPATESLSCVHQACTNLTHSCVWILLMRASNLHKPRPILRLSPYHACIKPAQTSPTPASESLSCVHQTCTNVNRSSVWIVLIRAPNLHKHHPLLRRNPSHACIKSAQTSLTPASESLSCIHQTCTNLTHFCVWILVMRASNLQKLHPPLCLNPSHACIRPAKTSPTAASVSFACLHYTCTNLTHS